MLAKFVVGMVIGTAALGAPTSPMPEPSPRCDISSAVPQFGGAYAADGVLHIWLTEADVDKNAAAATLARQCPTLVPTAYVRSQDPPRRITPLPNCAHGR